MITLEKFGLMKARLYDDAGDDEKLQWCRKWDDLHFDRLDSIRLVGDEFDHLVEPLATMQERGAELVENPALEEFELVISEPIPSVMQNHIRYSRTVLPKTPKRIPGKDGAYIEAVPFIDMHMSFYDRNIVDVISTIFVFHICMDGKNRRSGTMTKEMWRRDDPGLLYTIMRDQKGYIEHEREMKLIYIGIQRAMRNKPEVFVEYTGRKQSAGNGKGRRTRKRVPVVRVIRMNREQLRRYSTPQKHMSCPCWGVAGHWRRYKSGKTVWIAPYRKGKERNDPAAYRPKDYSFVQEGETK